MNDERDDVAWYVASIAADAELFAASVERGPLDAPVAACRGWDVADLAVHMGTIHRWARAAALTARSPDSSAFAPDATTRADPAALATWLREGAADLVTTLSETDPLAPTWHPFPLPKAAGIWPRRQAHETSIHRWDAEAAVGTPAPIDPELASDGIDEYWSLAVPRLVVREHLELPAGSFHLHCTDVTGEWLIDVVDGALEVRREHGKGSAALRGPAEAILLRLWDRTSTHVEQLEVLGDIAIAEGWLSVPGL